MRNFGFIQFDATLDLSTDAQDLWKRVKAERKIEFPR